MENCLYFNLILYIFQQYHLTYELLDYFQYTNGNIDEFKRLPHFNENTQKLLASHNTRVIQCM